MNNKTGGNQKKSILDVAKYLMNINIFLEQYDTSLSSVFNKNVTFLPLLINYKPGSNLIINNSGQILEIVPNEEFDIDSDDSDQKQYNVRQMNFKEIYDFINAVYSQMAKEGRYIESVNLEFIQLINSININIKCTNECDEINPEAEDYFNIYKIWWQLQTVAVTKRSIMRSISQMLHKFMLPIAVFDATTKKYEKLIMSEIDRTPLKEHLIVKEMGTTTQDMKQEKLSYKIVWVSYKNAMEFLDENNIFNVSPVNILELLLTNGGFIKSDKYEQFAKIYENKVDQYGLYRSIDISSEGFNV